MPTAQPPKKRKLNLDDLVASFEKKEEPNEKGTSLQEMKAEADERMQSLLQLGRKSIAKAKDGLPAEANGQLAQRDDTAQQKLDVQMWLQQSAQAQAQAQQEAQQEVSVLDEMKKRTQKAMEARKQMLGGAEPKAGARQGQASQFSNHFAKSKPSSPPVGLGMSSSHLAVEEQTSTQNLFQNNQETASPLSNMQMLPSGSSGSLEEPPGLALEQASAPEQSPRDMKVSMRNRKEVPALEGSASKPSTTKRRSSKQIVADVQKFTQEVVQSFQELSSQMANIKRSPQMIVAEVQRQRLEVLQRCQEQTSAVSNMADFMQKFAQAGQQPQEAAKGDWQDKSSWKKTGWNDSGWKDSAESSWKDKGWKEDQPTKELEIWDGDWTCPMCKSLVFSWREQCPKCGVPKELGVAPELASDFKK